MIMGEIVFENRVAEEKRGSSFPQDGISTREERKRLAPFSGILIVICFVILLSCCEEEETGYGIEPPTGSRHDCDYPAWSPKDDYIAYSYLLFNPEVPEDTVGLYLFDLSDSTYAKILGDNPLYVPLNPDFSPDGKWLVFRKNSIEQIWKSTIMGDSLQQLTFGGKNFSPDWSPDGEKIIYFHYVIKSPEDSSGIYIMNKEGTNKEWFVYGRSPVWIDNDNFVYSRSMINEDMAIYRYDLKSRQREKIIDYEEDWGGAESLALSRTASRLVFVVNDNDDALGHLWTVNLDGTDLTEITPEGGADSPAWSPDGSTILYVSMNDGQIYLMDPDGSNRRPLINSEESGYESGRNIMGVGLRERPCTYQ